MVGKEDSNRRGSAIEVTGSSGHKVWVVDPHEHKSKTLRN